MAYKCPKKKSQMAANAASWYCVIFAVALILLNASLDGDLFRDDDMKGNKADHIQSDQDFQRIGRTCDEIYVVGEGETLHTISDKCKDPFIVEQNPHIQDPDDVFPGLVIKITPRNRII